MKLNENIRVKFVACRKNLIMNVSMFEKLTSGVAGVAHYTNVNFDISKKNL